jgi:hypothetical protein
VFVTNGSRWSSEQALLKDRVLGWTNPMAGSTNLIMTVHATKDWRRTVDDMMMSDEEKFCF